MFAELASGRHYNLKERTVSNNSGHMSHISLYHTHAICDLRPAVTMSVGHDVVFVFGWFQKLSIVHFSISMCGDA